MVVTCTPSPTLELDCPLVEHSIPAAEPAVEPAVEPVVELAAELAVYWLSGRTAVSKAFSKGRTIHSSS